MKTRSILICIIVILAIACSPVLAISKSDLIASYELAQDTKHVPDGKTYESFFPTQYGTVSELIKGSIRPTPIPTPHIRSWVSPTPTPTPTQTPEETYLPYIHGSCDSFIIPTASSTKASGGNEFLTIRSNPEGAFIYLDGRFKGLSPLLLTGLSAGSHQLKLTKFGYADYITNFTVLEGRSCSGNMRPYPGCENWLPCITLKEINQIHGGLK